MGTAPYSVLGGQSEATIDQANIAMRGMPWYQNMLRAWGQDPGHPTINDSQRTQLTRAAQANGFVVDEGNIEMDDHGNFNPIGHKLRNTIIVAGIAAATIATMGAAGVFAAGAGGGAGAAGAGAGVAGVEGGAAGLSSSALAGLGTGAMGAVPVAAGVGGAAAAGGPVLEGLAAGGSGATTIPVGAAAGGGGAAGGAGAWDAAGNFIGDTTYGSPAFDAAGNFIGDSSYNIPAAVAGAGGAGRTYADLLRYGLPVAGGLAGSIIQANATGAASAAQTKYLEDALAYEKESDLYNRGVAAAAVQKEAQRYSDYQGRIGPFIENGTNSNDRMAALLGLPARAGGYGGGSRYDGGGSASGGGGAVADPAVAAFIADWQNTHAPSEGIGPLASAIAQKFPTVSRYMYGATPSNNELSLNGDKYKVIGAENSPNAYWYTPGTNDSPGASSYGVQTATGVSANPARVTTPTLGTPTGAQVQGAPVARSLVQIRTTDGGVQSVPADQVPQYLQRGATVLNVGA